MGDNSRAVSVIFTGELLIYPSFYLSVVYVTFRFGNVRTILTAKLMLNTNPVWKLGLFTNRFHNQNDSGSVSADISCAGLDSPASLDAISASARRIFWALGSESKDCRPKSCMNFLVVPYK